MLTSKIQTEKKMLDKHKQSLDDNLVYKIGANYEGLATRTCILIKKKNLTGEKTS